MTLSLAGILAESAARHPDRDAVVLGPERVTYAQLWEQTRRYAAALAEQGIGPGDRVAVLLPNVPDFARVYYAALSLGAVVVPVHGLLVAREITYLLRDSGARVLVTGGPLLGQGRPAAADAGIPVLTVLNPPAAGAGPGAGSDAGSTDGAAEVALDRRAAELEPIDTLVGREAGDEAVILYTSGTTGFPKGAVLTQLNMTMNAWVTANSVIDLRPGDVILGCLPLFHSFGQTCAMNAGFLAGSTLVLMPRFDGAGALALMVEQAVTVFMGVPTMYIGLLAAAGQSADGPPRLSLRRAISGGASLPRAVLDAFGETFGAAVYEGYGLSETSPVATFNQEIFGRKPGTVGRPVWGTDARIAAPDVEGRIDFLPTGEVGEVVLRGHHVFAGYLGNPDATAAVLIDGWFRTGDLGSLDDDGFLTIVDRKKDLILRGGFNVYPREVEEVLATHPQVAQVAVIGLPDATHGEEICAVVVRRPAPDGSPGDQLRPDDLIAWAREHMGGHKYPRRVEFVDEMPLGPSGKVLKRELIARRTSAGSERG